MKTLLVSTVEHAGQFTRQATTVVVVHETTPGKTVKYLSVSNVLMALCSVFYLNFITRHIYSICCTVKNVVN